MSLILILNKSCVLIIYKLFNGVSNIIAENIVIGDLRMNIIIQGEALKSRPAIAMNNEYNVCFCKIHERHISCCSSATTTTLILLIKDLALLQLQPCRRVAS